MKSLLIEGLSQSSVDCILPEVHVKKTLSYFINHEYADEDESVLKLVAHPPKASEIYGETLRIHKLFQEIMDKNRAKRIEYKKVVVAIGPEGGWEEHEVATFEKLGFRIVDLGERILRTDVAVSVFPPCSIKTL